MPEVEPAEPRDDQALLVFDGRCGFCRRFVRRWQQLTGERVVYRPFYEDAANPLPAVAPAALREAVHLRLPDGRIVAGADAVAELGAFTADDSRLPIYRALHRHVPGVAPLSRLGYRVVARHRRLFDRLTRTFVGPDLRRPRQVLVRWLFLRMLGLCALAATISWWVQLDGLIGARGIAPAADYLAEVSRVAAAEGWSSLETLLRVPTLAWDSASDAALHELCALAALGSLMLFLNVLPGVGLLFAWLGYLSLVSVGQVFMGYQWDALLLESLFCAFFLVPWRGGLRPGLARERAPSWAGVWLARLLVVKLVFLSGVVKLLSDDPVWADLSALDYHYWTQPLPAPTSWSAHYAPAWLHDLSIRVMFAIELVLPWFVLVGLRRLRYLTAYAIFALMLAIGLTGNYGYFNLLTVTLAIMLFDDGAVRALVPPRLRAKVPDSHEFAHRRPRLAWRAPVALLATALALLSVTSFVRRIDRDAAPSALVDALRLTAPLHLAQGYGLFATMTTDRPEIELAGSADGVDWRPYRFTWKAGALDETPSYTGPHMPRLDWQMWFSALAGECRRSPWYLAFARRLLEGSPPVLALLADDPFPEGPPRFLRSELWYYSFTTPSERAETGHVWHREPAGRLFCPTLELDGGRLRAVGR